MPGENLTKYDVMNTPGPYGEVFAAVPQMISDAQDALNQGIDRYVPIWGQASDALQQMLAGEEARYLEAATRAEELTGGYPNPLSIPIRLVAGIPAVDQMIYDGRDIFGVAGAAGGGAKLVGKLLKGAKAAAPAAAGPVAAEVADDAAEVARLLAETRNKLKQLSEQRKVVQARLSAGDKDDVEYLDELDAQIDQLSNYSKTLEAKNGK